MTVCGVVDFYQFLEECASSIIWLKNIDIFGLVRLLLVSGMEVACYFKIVVDLYQTTWCHMPKDRVYNLWSFDSFWFNGGTFTLFEIKNKIWIGIVDYAENRKIFKTLHRNVLVMVNVVITYICVLIACTQELCV